LKRGPKPPFFFTKTRSGGELYCSSPTTSTTTHSAGEGGEGGGRPTTGHGDVGGVAKPQPWLWRKAREGEQERKSKDRLVAMVGQDGQRWRAVGRPFTAGEERGRDGMGYSNNSGG